MSQGDAPTPTASNFGQPIDLYVILGAAVWPGGVPSNAMRRRVHAAITSARRSPNPRFLATGGVGQNPPSEASLMQKLLIESGVPAGDILLEEESTDTLSSVRNCSRIVRTLTGIATVTVCTDRYHIARTRWLFRIYGIRTRAGEIPSGRRQTGLRKWIYYCLREAPAIVQDTFLALASR
jgi:uncharacterized SAM-binding protein YcdF (DUF218 family)